MRKILFTLLLTTSVFAADQWETVETTGTPAARHEAAFVEFEGEFYLIGGRRIQPVCIFNPETQTWRNASKPPIEFHHFQAAFLDGKIYAAGGRRTSQETKQVFDLVVPEVDVYDLKTGIWSVLKENLPTPRAGNSTAAIGDDVVVAGGESMSQKEAHSEVEAWDTKKECWHNYPSLNRGRHGTSLILHKNCIYTCSGSGNRGGGPELKTTERLKLSE